MPLGPVEQFRNTPLGMIHDDCPRDQRPPSRAQATKRGHTTGAGASPAPPATVAPSTRWRGAARQHSTHRQVAQQRNGSVDVAPADATGRKCPEAAVNPGRSTRQCGDAESQPQGGRPEMGATEEVRVSHVKQWPPGRDAGSPWETGIKGFDLAKQRPRRIRCGNMLTGQSKRSRSV